MTWLVMKNTSLNQPPLSERKFLKSSAVQKLLGYEDKASFWVAVKAAGIPFIRINPRRILFDEAAVSAWLQRRTVGDVQ